jgi:threonyl-tRNA synthetase
MVLKPMNCPHHIQIYAGRPRSYKELPIRYMESTIQYRDEKKGELNGLSRVRSISIDDSHVFCTEDQIENELSAVMEMVKEMYTVFDMKFRARLSFRDDSDEYLGGDEVWNRAQKTIEQIAKKASLEYSIAEGDAAFYGPKLDIMITDSLGREWQCATAQLDFVQPERFKLGYTDADGSEKTPVMIHKALLGSFERFLSVYLEHTNGNFPLWLAPEQLRVVALNDDNDVLSAVTKLVEKAKELRIRVDIDISNESVGKKVRDAEQMRVPYMIVIGGKEVESGKVTPRVRNDLPKLDKETWETDYFLSKLVEDTKNRK